MSRKKFYYTYVRNSLDLQKVLADSIEFTPTHILFKDDDGSLTVAVRAADVAEVWEEVP